MTTEANKALIRRFFEEVMNGDKTDTVDQSISVEQIETAALPGQEASEPEEGKQRLAVFFHAAVPALRQDLEGLIAEEEKVVARWRMEAINEGEFMGIAATEKRVSVSGINVYCIANCQVVEHWHEMYTLGLMQQPSVTS